MARAQFQLAQKHLERVEIGSRQVIPGLVRHPGIFFHEPV